MTVSYDTYGDFHALDGTCYNILGTKQNCGRILNDPTDDYTITIFHNQNEREYFRIIINNNEIASFIYHEKEGAYQKDYVSDTESVFLTSPYFCTYYFKGDSEQNETLCTEKEESIYTSVKENYEQKMTELDLNMDDVKQFAAWFMDGKGKDLKKQITEKKASQKPITSAEIKTALSSDYDLVKLTNGIVVDSKSRQEKFIYLIGSTEAISYDKSIYDNAALYVYPNGGYSYMTEDKTCAYSITDEKMLLNTTCSEENIKAANILQISFQDILQRNRFTLDELFDFFRNYK